MRILFVCMGNICRSPTAEGVVRHLLAERGLENEIEVESAGTGGWHAGSPPDARSARAAAARGITLEGAARQVTRADFEEFDLLVAMDRDNLTDLQAIAPPGTEHKVRLLLADGRDVPDPYYGGPHGFENVLDLVEAACEQLLDELR
ncbi:MAG TPA: low molecular weight protein-tyrosine-phosphatase [Solirubrobacteraceae bacterium]|nr:low molecular weight protein-tyrosine-phosphatase [Solirubrobacteraceae bacterium]